MFTFLMQSGAEAWNIKFARLISNVDLSSQQTVTQGFVFKPDGTKLFIVGSATSNKVVHQYSLSSAWDVETASYDSKLKDVGAEAFIPIDVEFSSDGTIMYVYDFNTADIFQYTLSTAWDVSTASYASKSYAPNQPTPDSLFFKDSTVFYVIGSGRAIGKYTLSTAWDISTASLTDNSLLSTDVTDHDDAFFKPDGKKLYVSEGTAAKDEYLLEYDLSTAWDVDTATYNNVEIDLSIVKSNIFFSPDGVNLYTLGNDIIYRYMML